MPAAVTSQGTTPCVTQPEIASVEHFSTGSIRSTPVFVIERAKFL
jgi:hypothetical protein